MTKKITSFNTTNLEMLRVEIQEALNAIAAKHGIIAARLGRMGYQADHFKASIEFGTATTEDGEVMVDPKLYDNMKRHGYKVGFSVDDIGKSILLRDIGNAKIVGMAGYTKIAVQTGTGSIYRVQPEVARRLLAAK